MIRLRSLAVCSFIFLIQVFYHLLVVEIDPINLIVCLLVFLILSVSIVFSTGGNRTEFSLKNKRIFIILFITSFVTTIITSRADYIVATIQFGLGDARNIVSLQAGGAFTAINILFYPMALVAFLANWNRRLTLALLIPVLVCDVIFLGTRNSVFFVVVFLFIHYQKKISIGKNISYGLLIFILLIISFEYTVSERSGEVSVGINYWSAKLDYSGIGALNKTNPSIHTWAEDISWIIYPIIHLISYLSHSVSEFVHFISNSHHRIFPTLLHLQDSLLMAFSQDRGPVQAELAQLKVRSGFYNTMFAAWYIELGVLSVPLFLIILFYLRFGRFFAKLVGTYFIVVLALGGIENYLFTGLTLLRFFLFLVLGSLFLRMTTVRKSVFDPMDREKYFDHSPL